jgi:hypothetical protein
VRENRRRNFAIIFDELRFGICHRYQKLHKFETSIFRPTCDLRCEALSVVRDYSQFAKRPWLPARSPRFPFASMNSADPQPLTVTVNNAQRVSGLLQAPPGAHACYVLAHGAGAGMAHPFMAAIAQGLAERGVATLRYQFPYMEQGSSDRTPKLAQPPSAQGCWKHHA